MNDLAGGGKSPHDRSMEARVAVLEEIAAATKGAVADLRQEVRGTNQRIDALRDRVDKLREDAERDFRMLFGALITGAIGLAALMAKGFHWF